MQEEQTELLITDLISGFESDQARQIELFKARKYEVCGFFMKLERPCSINIAVLAWFLSFITTSSSYNTTSLPLSKLYSLNQQPSCSSPLLSSFSSATPFSASPCPLLLRMLSPISWRSGVFRRMVIAPTATPSAAPVRQIRAFDFPLKPSRE